jgi:hypothetical protein
VRRDEHGVPREAHGEGPARGINFDRHRVARANRQFSPWKVTEPGLVFWLGRLTQAQPGGFFSLSPGGLNAFELPPKDLSIIHHIYDQKTQNH